MTATIKSFSDLTGHLSTPSGQAPPQLQPGFELTALQNDDNLTYVMVNTNTREGIVIDPMREDWEKILQVTDRYKSFSWIFVMDTHTHADHISSAARVAAHLSAPYVLHQSSPSKKIDLRVSRPLKLHAQAGGIEIVPTPGHTPDSLCMRWGAVFFSGDTLLYNDIGRDDLPGGDPSAHFDSVEKIKDLLLPTDWVAFGHDGPGRLALWGQQLEQNPMLKMDRVTFVKESASYVGPSPKNLKESLFENFQ